MSADALAGARRELLTVVATVPIAAWEFTIGVWMIVKGFRPAPSTDDEPAV